MSDALRAPFPWFGGKSRVAGEVWRRFGGVSNYVEPFFGSGAVLLARPGFDPENPVIETANDMNGWLCNFWRAASTCPEAVAEAADYPVSELDLHARGDAIFYRDDWYQTRGYESVDAWIEWLRADPGHCDALIAGWWVWGQSCWIGDNWDRNAHNARRDEQGNAVAVTRAKPEIRADRFGCGVHQGHVERKRPQVAGDRSGNGVHADQVDRKLPALDGDGNRGIHSGHVWRQRPDINGSCLGGGVHRQRPAVDGHGDTGICSPSHAGILARLTALQTRLRRVRICCGDWSRVCGNTPLRSHGVTGVFLDPPYGQVGRDSCYGEHEDFTVAAKVRAWALEHGADPKLRIALCGYEGEHDMPGWSIFEWKAVGGYGNQRRDGSNHNARRERVWFSPHCLKHDDCPLFADGGGR